MGTKVKETCTVLNQECIGKDIYSMWIQTKTIAGNAKPGQFVSVYTQDGSKLLPRPISLCEIDKEKGALRNNTVVTTIMSNFGLYKAFDELGIDYEKTQVGDKYVYENMVKNGHRIGGEQSGHIIFGKYANTGDGILTAIKLMQAMLSKKMPLSKLTQDLKIYPQVLKNVRVQDKERALNDFAVQNAVREVSAKLGDQGRILLRKSGTEPVLRVMVEAPTNELCEENVDAVIAVMRQRGLIVEAKK